MEKHVKPIKISKLPHIYKANKMLRLAIYFLIIAINITCHSHDKEPYLSCSYYCVSALTDKHLYLLSWAGHAGRLPDLGVTLCLPSVLSFSTAVATQQRKSCLDFLCWDTGVKLRNDLHSPILNMIKIRVKYAIFKLSSRKK